MDVHFLDIYGYGIEWGMLCPCAQCIRVQGIHRRLVLYDPLKAGASGPEASPEPAAATAWHRPRPLCVRGRTFPALALDRPPHRARCGAVTTAIFEKCIPRTGVQGKGTLLHFKTGTRVLFLFLILFCSVHADVPLTIFRFPVVFGGFLLLSRAHLPPPPLP